MEKGKFVILCVDDDPDIRYTLKIVIEENGYKMVEANSSEEAVETFKKTKPDLIIFDLMMEEVDSGINFVKELRLLGNTAPVYMLSSVGDNFSQIADYSKFGISGVFQKPIDNNELLSIIKTKLKR